MTGIGDLIGDMEIGVRKKCKRLFKKSFWDTSWKSKVSEVMGRGYQFTYDFIYSTKNDNALKEEND